MDKKQQHSLQQQQYRHWLCLGCNSGLSPDTFEVMLDSEYSPGIISDRTYTILSIRSLIAEPISVTGVAVNGGRCTYSQLLRQGDRIASSLSDGSSAHLIFKVPV